MNVGAMSCAIAVAMVGGACTSAHDAAEDGGPGGARAGVTRFEIWARLPGVTAEIAGARTVLDAEGGEIVLEPGIRGTSTVLRLEHGSDVVELPITWAADYEYLGLGPDTLIEGLAIAVQIGGDETCVAGWTNGAAGGHGFTSLLTGRIGACGPFGFRRFRLDVGGRPCGEGESCTSFIEISGDGHLRTDPFGGTTDVTEATLSDTDLARARVTFGAGELLSLLSTPEPCDRVSDSSAFMTVETSLETASAQVAGCTLAPISAARDLAYELADAYATP